MKPLVVVTGINGQLGSDIQIISKKLEATFDFLFASRNELNLQNEESINHFFERHQPQYFINAAAYTAVDKAETESEIAFKINAYAVEKIAQHCALIGCTLLHISTDYIFDGTKNSPYNPLDTSNPLNVYGSSKLLGEKLALEANINTLIVRTSWVYNKTGKNFVNTMQKLMRERESISVVNDQMGCPTYSPDLALALLNMIDTMNTNKLAKKNKNRIYHYSNSGAISWFDFALEIKKLIKSDCVVNGIPSSQYPTPAKRSNYSVMNTSDLTIDFGINMINWKDSLKACLDKF